MSAVKVIVKRRFKEGKTKGVFALLNQFRSVAMEQPGFIYGETLINYDNPLEVVVIAMWNSIENWLAWKESKEREANEQRLAQWMEEPAEVNVYVLGTHPPRR